ncbi:hypothetical protein [Seohaeicola zhoushanensis]|uniref:Tetratricopeptide repeat protein n=1 Tax=Seohaeicola zhoushanensis TaxID=1569283 RepID=A0A8J3GYE8_9RHOB|nr:hypothetical protein [Seohaeicola zhoushanensis]GHF51163.1 hypothetical protein GCM10017056_23580 [Seohaeicola zhoushanensis]
MPPEELPQFAPDAAELEAAPEADLTDEAELLDQLAHADAASAKRYEKQLQRLWNRSGSPSADLLLKRGREALEVKDVKTAIEHLTALTDHAPDFAEGWHARASAYFAADLLGPAIADLEHTLALNPNNYGAIFGLGVILEGFGDKKRAYEAYLRAQSIHPHHEDISAAVERLRSQIEGKAL